MIVEVLAIMNHLSPNRWESMVEFVQRAFDSVRVLDKGLFEQCTQRIQMMARMVKLVDLGGRSSSVSKEGCGDVEVCCAMGVLRFHRC